MNSDLADETYDYIVVGAGSSGCVLASELSAISNVRVLVVESGPSDRSVLIDMPRGIAKLLRPGDPHVFTYEVDRGGNRKPDLWLKGRGLGGSSSINGMVYARGFPADYDSWEAQGCTDWGWAGMAPVYKAIENHELGAGDERGGDGPLHITSHALPSARPLGEAVLKAAEQAGMPRIEDTNQAAEGGIGYQPRTIWHGRRQSASKAFLRPALRRPNLKVMVETDVLRVVFEGKRAVGVEVRQGSRITTIRADQGVILSAGGVVSPKILQLSGVGSADYLRQFGIDVVADSPNVGKNLREHYYISTKYRISHGSLNPQFGGPRLALNVLRYFAFGGGPLSHAAQEIVGYFRSRPGLDRPDCQLGIQLFSLSHGAEGVVIDKGHGMAIGGYFMHPRSQGEVRILSTDPDRAPYILGNYLAIPEDRAATIALVRFARAVAASPALAPYRVEELTPGPAVQSDEDILDYCFDTGGMAFHVSGTCRMGSDEGSVVDPRTRVRGVTGLHVVDTSIFPDLISGNTNAPAMAAGYKAARMILADGGITR